MKKVTKKVLDESESLCKKFGYWSKEISDFISAFHNYNQRQKIHNHLNKFR